MLLSEKEKAILSLNREEYDATRLLAMIKQELENNPLLNTLEMQKKSELSRYKFRRCMDYLRHKNLVRIENNGNQRMIKLILANQEAQA